MNSRLRQSGTTASQYHGDDKAYHSFTPRFRSPAVESNRLHRALHAAPVSLQNYGTKYHCIFAL